MAAATAIRSTVGLALRQTAATTASSRISSSASANARRMMQFDSGRRGYTCSQFACSPSGEWEWMDAWFAAPAAAGAVAYGYLWWVVLPEKKPWTVKMGEEQEMILGRIGHASGAEQTNASNM